MFKINRLGDWRSVGATPIAFIGEHMRTVSLQINAEEMTSVWLIGYDLDGKPTEERLFLGAHQGLEKYEFTAEGNFAVQCVAKTKNAQVWYLDARDTVATVAPVGESFTRFEKRGMSAPDPIALALHQQSVLTRLKNREAEVRETEHDRQTQSYIAKLEARLDKLEKQENDAKAEDRAANAGGNAGADGGAADSAQGTDGKAKSGA